ncbi:caspase family protein [Flaviaesturariibacter terrae]
MRRLLCFLLILLAATGLRAQERGIKVTPYERSANSPLKGDSGQRKAALIVGISDYSSKRLQLQYANRDAVLFYNYLTSVRAFPKENVFLLPDSAATSGRIYNAILDMMRWLNKGDELVLYFAGHGDVQTVADFDEAFFLAWDASDTRNYHGAAGTLKLSDLELYTNRLASVKKVKVTLVMDACHSGFSVHNDGILKAQDNIVSSFNQISKMLGCAVNEFSFEADSVGHGLFTWYLVQGMMGLANTGNNQLTLNELAAFVKGRVGSATRGRQNPVLTAPDGNNVVAELTPAMREQALRFFQGRQYGQSLAGRGNGAASDLPDSLLEQYVNRYNRFLLRERLYGSDSSCLAVIAQLGALPEGRARDLQQGLQNHLAEVLETRSQLVLNDYLKGLSLMPPAATFYTAGIDAALADSLLPAGDPRHRNDRVMAAFHIANSYLRYDRYEKFGEAESLLRGALQLENRAAYVYLAMAHLKRFRLQYDSALYYAGKAHELIPTWSHARNELGNLYNDIYQHDEAIGYYQQVLRNDSNYAWAYNNIATIMYDIGRTADAERYYRKALALKEENAQQRQNRDFAISYSNLGNLYNLRGLPAIAERYFLKADSTDATFTQSLKNLGDFYNKTDGRKAEAYYRRMIAANPYDAAGYLALAEFYRNGSTLQRYQERADSLFSIGIALNPYDQEGYAGKGLLWLDRNRPDSALPWFRKAVEASRGSDAAWFSMTSYYDFTRQTDSLLAVYARALAINPYRYDIAQSFSNELLRNKDTARAEAVLLASIRHQPLSPLVHYQFGNFLFQTGRSGRAVAAYQKALQVDSSFSQALAALAYMHLARNEVTQSLECMERLRRLLPYDDRVQDYIGMALEKSRAQPEAQRYAWLQRFVPLDTTHIELRIALAEAAYRSNRNLQAAFRGLQRAEAATDYLYPAAIRWLLLLAIENRDGAAAKTFARRYLDETLNTEPAIAAVALQLTGHPEEARRRKKEAGTGIRSYFHSNFIKYFSGL